MSLKCIYAFLHMLSYFTYLSFGEAIGSGIWHRD